MTGDQPTVHYHNHILLGLGGTGGLALRELRKELYQRHRDRPPASLRLEYLYIDSSEADLNESESWRVLGTSVQLPNDSRMLIAVPDLRTMIDNAPQYPGIAQWVGDPAIWRNYLDNVQGLRAAGGQRRRMGRLLAAASIRRFRDQLAQHYNRVTVGNSPGGSGNEGVTFHVLCGLAGGTGSGSVVDIVIQIGKFIKERRADRTDRILIYALLPEENPVGGREARYYFANGYAALLELNALSTGRFVPHDVADPQGRRIEPERIAQFNGCYVFSNKTETGTVYDTAEMPGLLASFLYQKIVAVGDAGEWQALVRQENSENGNPSPEPRVANHGDAPGPSAPPAPERSVRFLAFGIKRVAVPEQEIREYLAYSFARQALLQLRFNHWADSFGFIETPRNSDFSQYRGPALLEAFRLTDDHVVLSRPILDSDQTMEWKPIEEFWQVYLGHLLEDVAATGNKNFVVGNLIAKATEWFDTGYRNVGARPFYDRKSATVAHEAREILRLIEDHLFREWLSGSAALIAISGSRDAEHPVRGILQTLRDEVEERRTRCLASAPHCATQIRELMEKLDAIEHDYARVGAIDLFKRRQRLQTDAARVLETLLAVRTRALGYAYAVVLCDAVLRELDDFAGEVTACAAVLQNALDAFDKAITKRCQDHGPPDFARGFVKFYDAENVRRLTKRLVLDRDVQAAQAGAVRTAIHQRMTSHRPTFRELHEQLDEHQLSELLEQQAFEHSRTAHDALGLKPHERLFGLSILEQVLAKYPSRQARKQFAEAVIPQASTLARIDATEAENNAANPQSRDLLRRSLSVIGAGLTPTAGASAPAAVAELKAELQSALRAPVQTFEFVEAPGQTSDLCIISLTNLMPLRTVEHVAFLRQKYDEMVHGAAVAPEDKLFLHLEGDGSEYPGLYELSLGEVRKRARPVLLLASALGLLQEQRDPRTGRSALVYTELDEFGVPSQIIAYGENPVQACAGIDGPRFRRLEAAVDAKLGGEDYLHQDRKKDLVGAVATRLKELLPLCGGSLQHDDYRRFTEAYQDIRRRLLTA